MVTPGRIYTSCERCKRPPTPEDHDACLGTLDESIVMNACCGHGEGEAYVQFWSGACLRGQEAERLILRLKQKRESLVLYKARWRLNRQRSTMWDIWEQLRDVPMVGALALYRHHRLGVWG